ncbi:lymphocyte antigen 6E [Microcaecilia unicolor]|uniref:Lymphocyte antigen 6E-like n=1 Tax=Microcaecilia unicolor TaxID=1415580 RepID=A0A6P7ZH77_9AMPH|nr:lymphocyte antigen 6E-like [Microcaecilia unicolor]
MRPFLLFLLVIALCLHNAVSLKCYTCPVTKKSSDCATESTCSVADKYCMKIIASASGETAVSKACTPDCTEGKQTISGATASVYCCQSDLCNGATSVKISYLALVISLGFLGSLLRAGL